MAGWPELAVCERETVDPAAPSSLVAVSAEPPLTDSDIAVLRALMEPERRVPGSTVEALSEASELGTIETAQTLRGLEMRQPPLARRLFDEALEVELWRTTF